MDMIPALEKDDLKRVGDVIWEIDFRGSKRAEVEHHSFEIYHYMSRLREAGFEFVGMSSVGPAIAVITERPEEDLSSVLKPMGLKIAIRTKIDNRGLQITHVPDPDILSDLFFNGYRLTPCHTRKPPVQFQK